MKARIGLLNPNPLRLRGGNRTTALRWALLLRRLGAHVFLEERWSGRPVDVLVALNAWKSAASIRSFRASNPTAPLVVVITGTDLYTDGPKPDELARSLDAATRIVVLQELAFEKLSAPHRAKAVLIRQSVRPLPDPPAPDLDHFDVCVVANLRPVKDPLLAARAARLLPASSRVRILLIGEVLDGALGKELESERAANPRLVWSGGRPRMEVLGAIASARLLASTSRAEGGGEVVSEAIAHGTPVLATDIAGSRGVLPAAYPGLFPVGDEAALAALLTRVEGDPAFFEELTTLCRDRAWITNPAHEESSWRELLASMLAES